MQQKIVIVGGGFAGVNLATKLKNKNEYQITLVDKNNYNFFQPLLYQVATGFLDVSNISKPFRAMFKNTNNIRFRMAELKKVEPEANKIQLSNGQIEYDLLVIATGSKSNFFGMDNIKKNALPMNTIDDAVTMRNYLLQKAEEAAYTEDDEKRARMRKIVISGAGPTGVEVAGMLAEMRNNIFANIYPELSKEKFEIYLVDGAPTVLPPMSEKSQQYTYETLKKMGVEINLDKMVEDYQENTVSFKNGDTIETETLIWTAGVIAKTFDGLPEDSYGDGNRLLVDEYNKVKNTENIYAIGDTCLQKTDSDFPDGHPQLADVAMQQGQHLADNFVNIAENDSLVPFKYDDKGTMAIIGKRKAVADVTTPDKTFTGWLAWVMWLVVHLFQLIGYKNRIETMWSWGASYFTQDQSLGMIIRPLQDIDTGQTFTNYEYETEHN